MIRGACTPDTPALSPPAARSPGRRTTAWLRLRYTAPLPAMWAHPPGTHARCSGFLHCELLSMLHHIQLQLELAAARHVHTVLLKEVSCRCWGAPSAGPATPRIPPCVQNSTRGSAAEPLLMASLISNSTCKHHSYSLVTLSSAAL
jgi:hypothetical protein